MGWSLLFIFLLYFSAPAYAAFSRLEILQNVVGQPIVGLPEWAVNWASAGLLSIKDTNGNGVFDNTTERASVTIPNGTNNGTFTLTFPVVPTGFTDKTYARFRLSTDTAAANSTR